jgi:hypothetical protein
MRKTKANQMSQTVTEMKISPGFLLSTANQLSAAAQVWMKTAKKMRYNRGGKLRGKSLPILLASDDLRPLLGMESLIWLSCRLQTFCIPL